MFPGVMERGRARRWEEEKEKGIDWREAMV